MFKKIANSVDMSLDIPDAEKEIANDAKMRFEGVAKSLKFAVDHLDILYEPFSMHENISTKSVIDNRGVLQGRYSSKVKENFTKAKKYGVLAIQKLNYFTVGDNSIRVLKQSFIESMGDLEESVSGLLDNLRNDYRLEDFKDKVLKSIENIREQADELIDLVYDRILKHINDNILNTSWMDFDNNQLSLDENVPLITELYEERQKALDGAMPTSDKPEQALNMSDATQMLHPDFVRVKNIGEFGV